MIKIVCVKKPEISYTLIGGKTYEVGRKEGDINFPNDQSISRHHGQIIVEHPIANVTNLSLMPNVCVTDLGSKFGTFINDGIEKKTTLSMREKMNLSIGDRFKFGLQWNEYKIEYTPLIATSSAVRDIQNLKTDICQLGAHLLSEWTNRCDYVVMESVTLTIKAVCALLSGKRIVTPAYFKELLKCYANGNSKFPDPSDFLPPLAEKPLQNSSVSFEPNRKRSKLFEGKLFMFVNSKHLKKLAVAVESGGGKTSLIASVTRSELKSPKSILMALVVEESTLEKSTLEAIEAYKQSGKRAIPEAEIGMAALHCSIDRNCNPLCNVNKLVFPSSRITSQTQESKSQASSSNASFQAVPETQDMVTQRSDVSYSIDVVEETMISPTSDRKTSSSSVDDISTDKYNPGPSSRKIQNPKKRQEDDVQELPTSKRRLPKETETFVEPMTKKPRKEPISSNKTLSNLFDSSSDEDDAEEKVAEKVVEHIRSETMDIDQDIHDNIGDAKIEDSINVEVNDTITVVPGTPATGERVVNPTLRTIDTQEDLFPTDVSIEDNPSVSAKRKLEEVDAPKSRAKARKMNVEAEKEIIQEKIKILDISKTSGAAKSETNSAGGNEVLLPCPTVFMKQVIIERKSVETNPAGTNGVNFKRFKKVTPLNASFRANSSVPEDSMSIRLVLDGDENCSFSTFPKDTDRNNGTKSTMEANQDQSGLFEDTSCSAPQPSTSRRATRSGGVSPSKPASNPISKQAAAAGKSSAEKPVDESQADFEKHVEGGQRVTRSRRNVPDSPPKPLRKKKQEEIQDMWTF